MQITQHAIDRYRLRVRDCSINEARKQLSGLLPLADEVRDFCDGRRELGVGDLRLVVVDDYVVTCYLD